jgi:CHAT domain-containing protein/tetratricopeptide (TPR) repeat protein
MIEELDNIPFSLRLLQNYVLYGRRLLMGLPVLLFSISLAQAESLPRQSKTNPLGQEAKDQGTPRLEQAKPIARKLAGGQAHRYEILLGARQFLHAIVEQQGIDVVVVVFNPEGKQILEVDSPNGIQGPESVLLITEEAGIYRLEVRSSDKGAPAGSYEARIEVQREPRPEDLARIAAETAVTEAERLHLEGTALAKRQSIAKYEEALLLIKAAGERQQEVIILNNIGVAYDSLGEKQKSVAYFNQALPIARATGDRGVEVAILHNLNMVYDSLGEKQKATEYYYQLLLLTRGRHFEERAETNNLDPVLFPTLKKQKGHSKQALSIIQATSNRAGEAYKLNQVGLIYQQFGEYQKALECLNQALQITRVTNDRAGEATTLNNLGVVYSPMGEKQKALDYYHQALLIRGAIGDRAGEVTTLSNIGLIHNSLGDTQKALDYYHQALQISKSIGSRLRDAHLFINLGSLHDLMGEKQKALDYYQQALPALKTSGDRLAEATTLNNIGEVYRSLGESQKALDYYNRSLSISSSIGSRPREALVLTNIGSLYFHLGEHQKALDYFNQALPIAKSTAYRAFEASILSNIGFVRTHMGEHQKALDYFNQTLSIRKQTGNRAGEATALANIGMVYHSLADNQKALEYCERALPIAKETGDRALEASTLNDIGVAYGHLGELQKARSFLTDALLISRAIGDLSTEFLTHLDLARVERASGNLSQARQHAEGALNIIESLRLKIAGPDFRSSFLASVLKAYESYIDLLMHLHKLRPADGLDRLAFQVAEKARARSLIESLIEARADIRKGGDPSLFERERSLRSLLDAKIERRVRLLSGKHSIEQATVATKEVEALLSEYKEVQSQIRAKSPQYAALTQPVPLTLQQVQQQVLGGDDLLLEYSLGQDRSFLWAVTQSSLKSFELPKQEEIETAARRLYSLLIERNRKVKFETADERRVRIASADDESRQALATLSQILLGPVSRLLTKKRLLIVSDGALQYVPFAALPIPRPTAGSFLRGRPLIVAHEIINLPSASTLAVLRRELTGRRKASNAVAVLADPVFEKQDPRVVEGSDRAKPTTPGQSSTRQQAAAKGLEDELVRSLKDMSIADEIGRIQRLPFTRQEAKSIVSFVDRKDRLEALDFDASRATALSPVMARYKFVHFATHAVFNSEHPELSGIILSLVDKFGGEQDGFLKAYDVYNLKLQAELVVLSSCRTALGKEVRGEGLMSLTRGFMYAGASRVLASLWNVSDEPTAHLMSDFYKDLLGRRRLSPAAAIRAAQIRMLKSKRWQAPYYWAGFVLQGEPK